MDLVFAVAILSLLPLIIFRPAVGIVAWYWVSFMNPHQLIWGSLSNISYAQYIAIATMLAWAVSREPKRIPLNLPVVLLFTLAAWITFTTFFAQHPGGAWQDWNQNIKVLLMTVVAMGLMGSRERIHALVWITVISIGYFSVKGGVFTILQGGLYRVYGAPNSMIADNNAMAAAAVMTLPLIYYLFRVSAVRWVRYGLLFGLACSFFSVLGSLSRGAFLAVSAMAFMLVLKSRHKLATTAIVLSLGIVGAFFVPQRWIDRMETIANYEEDGSAMGRLRIWRFAYDMAVERPLTGVGFNAYYDEDFFLHHVPKATKAQNFHSIYFEMLGEHGFIGLAIFLLLGWVTWRTFGRIIRHTKGHPDLHWAEMLARMCQASFVGYATAGAFLNLAFFDLPYVLVIIAALLRQQVDAEFFPVGESKWRRARVQFPDNAVAQPDGPQPSGSRAASTPAPHGYAERSSLR